MIFFKSLFFMQIIFNANLLFAQNSVLINFGTDNCTNPNNPSFSLINNPLSSAPTLLSNCDMHLQQPDISSVFVAYNPKNNKVYVSDIRNGTDTKIWVLDIGLPNDIGCPINIPIAPTYSYNYISNNFEFDNNGNLWSFSNYDNTTGQCSLDMFDVNTGLIINTRILQFPIGNFPNTILSGDLCILPNGRMFATLGTGPSKLFEIKNYDLATPSIDFLSNIPMECYGIAYLNGILEITGSDFVNACYYYKYDISTNQLSVDAPFQVNGSPIDNSSITPAIGCTNNLINAVIVDSNTYDLMYEIYIENKGNVSLNKIDLIDNLGATFGPLNISNVQTSFVQGSNEPGFTLNSNYNGTTNQSILNPDHQLPNKISTNNNYSAKILLSCRVTNLIQGQTYFNSAISFGQIGSTNNNTIINVLDTSNNGDSTLIDPNKNGNANESVENIPTPFSEALLPVKFIDVFAKLINSTSSMIDWKVATPISNGDYFEVQFSSDAILWSAIGKIKIDNTNIEWFHFLHKEIPTGALYYRIKQVDQNGQYVYSKIVFLKKGFSENNYIIYPNPSKNIINISSNEIVGGEAKIDMSNLLGEHIGFYKMHSNHFEINTSLFANGTYILKITDKQNSHIQKVIVKH